MTKAESQRIHAHRRLIERFGIYISNEGYQNIIMMIQSTPRPDSIVFLDRTNARLTRWLVEYDSKKMVCVYDKRRKTIVTFLPIDDCKDHNPQKVMMTCGHYNDSRTADLRPFCSRCLPQNRSAFTVLEND